MTPTVAELRAEAARIRRAAAVPTVGGQRADAILRNLAEQLEAEADQLERETKNKGGEE